MDGTITFEAGSSQIEELSTKNTQWDLDEQKNISIKLQLNEICG